MLEHILIIFCALVFIVVIGFIVYQRITTKVINRSKIKVEVIDTYRRSELQLIAGKFLMAPIYYYVKVKAIEIKDEEPVELKVSKDEYEDYRIGDKAYTDRVVFQGRQGKRYFDYEDLKKVMR